MSLLCNSYLLHNSFICLCKVCILVQYWITIVSQYTLSFTCYIIPLSLLLLSILLHIIFFTVYHKCMYEYVYTIFNASSPTMEAE